MKNRKQKGEVKSQVRREEKRRDKTSLNQRRIKDAARSQNAATRKGAKTITGPKSDLSTTAKLAARVKDLNPGCDLALWTQILARPFQHEGVFCPVNYNPAPSFIQSTARTYLTDNNLSVTANTTTQFAIFPGHGRLINIPAAVTTAGVGPMDGVSYHALDQRVNGVTYVVGPMSKADSVSTKSPIIAVMTAGVTLGNAFGSTDIAGASALGYDVQLPYVSQAASSTSGAGGHSRWQLVAMGVRFHNVSPEIYRGGNMVSVQPNNVYALAAGDAPQETFVAFPTYHDHGCPDNAEISWIPRATDLAFWHGTDVTGTGTYSASVHGPAIMVWLNNPTANAQTYTYEIVCHWQLAGTYLNTVGRPAAHAPEAKPAVEKMISFLSNNSHTASSAPRVAAAAANHDGSKSTGSWYDTAVKMYNGGKSVAKAAARVAASVA